MKNGLKKYMRQLIVLELTIYLQKMLICTQCLVMIKQKERVNQTNLFSVTNLPRITFLMAHTLDLSQEMIQTLTNLQYSSYLKNTLVTMTIPTNWNKGKLKLRNNNFLNNNTQRKKRNSKNKDKPFSLLKNFLFTQLRYN